IVFVPAGPESIFPDTKTGRDIDFDGTYYELGTVFQASIPGTITHLRVYSLASESGDHTARIWRNDNESVLGGPYIWNYGVVADLTSGNITLQWEGDGATFQVEKAASLTGTFQPVGPVQTAKVFTDPGVLKTNAQSFYRVR